MESSCDPSIGRFSVKLMKDFFMISTDSSAHASMIHCKMVLLGGTFKLPAAVSSCIPVGLNHSSYFSVQEALNG